ncbi:MAG: hypothetical protein KAG99_08535, partial [Bacteroidales bacterium]|nr:hypothetical protein [Bacteroidales bacterium]
TGDGGLEVTERGVCWNTFGNPYLNGPHTNDGSGTGMFTSSIAGLSAETLYYVRAYATNEKGTGWGNEVTFTTLLPGAPSVTTDEATNITPISALCGGNVTDNGGNPVTSRGLCWSTEPNPGMDDNVIQVGYGTGIFTTTLSGLTPETTYYIKAWATNAVETSLGGEISFTATTYILPTVITAEMTAVTHNSATGGGNVTSEGNAPVIVRGVCWSTSQNPTINDNFTTDGTGSGNFISSLADLEPATTYYVKAYATNAGGTTYGSQISFMTSLGPCEGQSSFEDEGQSYSIVEIGYQCWMAENLNVGTMIDSYEEMTNNGIIEKYCYDNNPSNCDEYGGLYQWDEMMQYAVTPGAKGICPDGWHIPTDDEWKILEGTVDSQYPVGDSEWDNDGWRGFDVGLNLKSIIGWYNGWNGTDLFGFTALPGGLCLSTGGFTALSQYAYWWSSSEQSGTESWMRSLYYHKEESFRFDGAKTNGFSVRCLKDN